MRVAVSMGMLMRVFMRMNTGEFMRDRMRGKIGIEKSTMLMTLLAGFFRNTLIIMQVIDGILSGHITFPHYDSVLILNLTTALYIGIYL